MRDKTGILMIIISVILVVLLIIGMMWGIPQYNVWQKELSGKADLRKAEWDRQIAIEEARARLESEKLNAEAEVERAKGLAQANEILGDSLKGNHEYITYLYIQMMRETNNQIIYIPTESSLPILEAGRLN